MILWGSGDHIGGFFEARIGDIPPAGTYMVVTKGAEIVAGVQFHDYRPDHGTIELSVAADDPRWLTRAALKEIGAYVFDQLGCQAAVMRSDTDNTRVARIVQAVGFKRYDIPRLRGRDKSEAVYILAEEDWRGFWSKRA